MLSEINKYNVPQVSALERLGFKISLAINVLIKEIVSRAIQYLENEYLCKLNDEITIKILHLDSVITQFELPDELKKHLLLTSRNLPALKTYYQGDIKGKCNSCFAEFKRRMSGDLEELEDKRQKEINNDIDYLQKTILKMPINSCFSGVCHAMISQVANDYLSSIEENVSLVNYAKNFTKGVDENIAGLQLFMDAHARGASWSNLEAVDSLLGLTAIPTNFCEFTMSSTGLFHIALVLGGEKHSLLLHVKEGACQLLDPNIGIFEFTGSELKNFLKIHHAYYVFIMKKQEKYNVEGASVLFSDCSSEIYSNSCNGSIEVRRLEKVTRNKWYDDSGKVLWQREYTYEIVNGSSLKVQVE